MGSKLVFNVWFVLLHYPRLFLATQEMTNNNLTFIWMVSYVFYQCTCICICCWNLNNNFFWHKCTVIQTSRTNIFNKMSSEYYNSMWFQVVITYFEFKGNIKHKHSWFSIGSKYMCVLPYHSNYISHHQTMIRPCQQPHLQIKEQSQITMS